MSRVLERFCQDETGATSIEYALIAVLIAVVIIGGVTSVGNSVKGLFNNVTNGFS